MSKTIVIHYFLYKTTNLVNGKIYVGKHITKKLNDGYIGSGKLLKRAINKYGKENFKFEILSFYDNEVDLNRAEAELVTEEFCLRKDTYNLCVGGKGGFSYINRSNVRYKHLLPHTEEVKKKISNSAKKHWQNLSEEAKLEHAKIRSQSNLGKAGTFNGRKHTESTKVRMREAKGSNCVVNGKEYASLTEARKDLNISLFRLRREYNILYK